MQKRNLLFFLFMLFLASLAIRTSDAKSYSYPLEDQAAIVKPSYYSSRILRFLSPWPPASLSLHDQRPILVKAIRTPGRPDYIGMLKHYEVHAPLDVVERVTEDFQ